MVDDFNTGLILCILCFGLIILSVERMYAERPVRIAKLGHLDMTIKVVFTRRFRLRMYLGMALMRAAAWLLPCDVKIEMERRK